MFRVSWIVVSAALGAAGMASAQPVLPEGSILYWQSYQGYGDPESRSDEVVAAGEDFIVMRDREYGADSEADYYVEFSGAVLLNCAETMPNAEQRALLARLMADGGPGELVWNLDQPIAARLDTPATAVFMGKTVDVDQVSVRYGTEGEDGFATETLLVLKEPRATVEVRFDDGQSFDRLMAIRRPANPGSDMGVTLSELGTCGQLLAE